MTGNAGYTITEQDVHYAVDYLSRACRRALVKKNQYLTRRGMSTQQFLEWLERADLTESPHDTAMQLNDLCERSLDAVQWKNMRTSIRQKQYLQRKKMENELIHSVKLTPSAHSIIKSVIERNDARTLSEAIEYLASCKQHVSTTQ